MKKSIMFGASVLSGVTLAVAVASPALAWHPKGEITKSVQNITTSGELSDANTAEEAVVAKTGDTLKYVITIKNSGSANAQGYNDMHFTVLRDVLPVGVELVDDSTMRDITEDIGVIKPGESVTKEYTVKVVAEQDDAVITNKACFLGDSEVKDQPQAGCDDAVIKLDNPQVPEEEAPVDEPEEEGQGGADTPETKGATTLPVTGIGSTAGLFTAVSGLGYTAHRVITRKRQ